MTRNASLKNTFNEAFKEIDKILKAQSKKLQISTASPEVLMNIPGWKTTAAKLKKILEEGLDLS